MVFENIALYWDFRTIPAHTDDGGGMDTGKNRKKATLTIQTVLSQNIIRELHRMHLLRRHMLWRPLKSISPDMPSILIVPSERVGPRHVIIS